jgi:hypothetical protein
MHCSISAISQWMRSCQRSMKNVSQDFVVVGLMLASLPALAQNASVSGQVIDPSSALVRAAKVSLTNELTNVVEHSITNRDGQYSFPFVKPGKYTLVTEVPGFKQYKETDITIETAQLLKLDVKLQVGDAKESVIVDGSGIQINTTDGTVSTLVDQQFVENLPMNGRSFQSLLTAVPGVVALPGGDQWSVNGQRTDENYFTVDGISANAGYATVNGVSGGLGGMEANVSAIGTTQSMLSIDAMEEFRSSTSNYSAEYGRAPGGQFTITSRAGTKYWHGSAFDYLRNNAMDANNWFNHYNDCAAGGAVTATCAPRNVAQQAEKQNDFGGTFGGPLRIPLLGKGLDRTFFFASYEALVLQAPSAAQTYYVPSNDLRKNASPALAAFLAGFPTTSEPDLGGANAGIAQLVAGYSVPSRINATSLRMDHQFGDKVQVFARYMRSPSSSNGYCQYCYTPIAEWESKSNHTTYGTVGVTTMLSPRISNDLRLGLTQVNSAGLYSGSGYGGSTPYDFSDMPGFIQGQWKAAMDFNWGYDPELLDESTKNAQRQGNIVDSTTMNLGRHTIKFGVDFRRTSTWAPNAGYNEYANLDYDGVAADNVTVTNGATANEIEPYSVVYDAVAPYFKVYQFLADKPQVYNTGIYFQDEWRATARLHLSMGLRWDIDPAPSDGYGHNPYTLSQITNLAATYLVAPGQPLYKTQWNLLAPRIGFAYEIPTYHMVIRGGIGAFYDTTAEAASTVGLSGNSATNNQYGCSQPTAANNFTNGCYSWPLAKSNFPSVSATLPYAADVDPNLKAPYTVQWNLALQQSLGANQSLTISWVANAAQDLIRGRGIQLALLGNTSPVLSSSGSWTYFDTNGSQSNYSAMQVQFQRRLSKGLQLLAGYTWAHGQDDATGNATNYNWAWASSDYDVRQNFQVAGTYTIPGHHTQPGLSEVLDKWNIDLRLSTRTALPVTVIAKNAPSAGAYDGNYMQLYPNVVAGQSVYLYGSQYPGGKILNYNAFALATDASGNPIEGNFPRNAARAFGIDETDLAMHKDLSIAEGLDLQFRAEAFNVFNHTMFGAPSGCWYCGAATNGSGFGYSSATANTQTTTQENPLYQLGGPRSLQVALKLKF